MNKEEIIRLFSGPVNCYFAGGITYGRFVELIEDEFPNIKHLYYDLIPILFNHEPNKEHAEKYLDMMNFSVADMGSYWMKSIPSGEIVTLRKRR